MSVAVLDDGTLVLLSVVFCVARLLSLKFWLYVELAKTELGWPDSALVSTTGQIVVETVMFNVVRIVE